MIRFIEKLAVLVSLLALFSSCGKKENKGPMPAGSLAVNGTSVNGSVETGSVRIYLLSNIMASSGTTTNRYLVRATIAPGNTLTASVYSDYFSYRAGAAPLATSEAVVPNYFYEVSFSILQHSSLGDPVVVLSGFPSNANYSSVYFYGLRLMSANDGVVSAWTSTLVSSGTATAMATGSIAPDSLVVYSGASITPPGTYTVLLTSSAVTLSYPQMFIYDDNGLSLISLHYSAVSNSEVFSSATFTPFSTPTTTPSSTSGPFNTSFITNVSVPSASGGPFILLKGVSQATYTLEVGP